MACGAEALLSQNRVEPALTAVTSKSFGGLMSIWKINLCPSLKSLPLRCFSSGITLPCGKIYLLGSSSH
ncbi:hypothetical protein ILYODFUR_013833 [Ilyodon furcidens]|uniref:Uncharacterized protein n=1 Tax=Ilyodon furcidens TaxID=33524 RepID=A0ABV0TAP3_9TELE